MQGFITEIPQAWLDERTRIGLDRYDELWDGVLHMVPAPSYLHQMLGSELVAFLKPRLVARHIQMAYELGVHRPGSEARDYRIPDLSFFDARTPGLVTERGLVGAPLAVLEIRSRNDETYAKFPFWTELGVGEIIIIDPEPRRVEIYRLAGKQLVAVSADEQGRLHAATLDVRWSTVDGPRLRVEHAGAHLEV